MDLIIGKNHQSDLLIILDMATLISTIDKIKPKKSKHIKILLMKRLVHNKYLKTIIFDNYHAFSLPHEIAKQLGVNHILHALILLRIK